MCYIIVAFMRGDHGIIIINCLPMKDASKGRSMTPPLGENPKSTPPICDDIWFGALRNAIKESSCHKHSHWNHATMRIKKKKILFFKKINLPVSIFIIPKYLFFIIHWYLVIFGLQEKPQRQVLMADSIHSCWNYRLKYKTI